MLVSARAEGKSSASSSLWIGDTKEFPEAAEGVFDQMPVPVAVFMSADDTLTNEAVKNDRNGASLIQRSTKLVRVISFVAERIAHVATLFEQDTCRFHVAKTAARQPRRIKSSNDVGKRLALGRRPTARTADRLDLAPFSPLEVKSCALM